MCLPVRWGLLALLLSAPGVLRAQGPAWLAVASLAGPGPSNAANVAITTADASGNVYVAGSFAGTLQVGATTLVSAGWTDVFVAKWSPAANAFAWAVRAGGPADDYASALAVSSTGVYVGGSFSSAYITLGASVLTNAVGSGFAADAFIAKLTDASTTASFDWALRTGGTGNDDVAGLAANGSTVYVAGNFEATAAFGPTVLTSIAAADVFVAKLTDGGSGGSFVWTQQLGGDSYDRVKALTRRGNDLFLTGEYESTYFTLGGGNALANTIAGATTYRARDVFVVKYTDMGSSGVLGWGAAAGGGSNRNVTIGNAVVVSGTHVYVAGYNLGDNIRFGPSLVGNPGSSYTFVARLTDAGPAPAFDWAMSGAGDGALALTAEGAAVYVAGSFSGSIAAFGNAILVNAGGRDAFVAKLVDAGSGPAFAGAVRAGGTGTDQANALVLAGGRLYVGGYVGPPADFGATTLSGSAFSAGFLASITDATLTTTTPTTHAGFALVPNPARGLATFRQPVAAVHTPLLLLDALGREVRRYSAPAGTEATLDLRGLPAGVYVLRHGSGSQRLVVE